MERKVKKSIRTVGMKSEIVLVVKDLRVVFRFWVYVLFVDQWVGLTVDSLRFLEEFCNFFLQFSEEL